MIPSWAGDLADVRDQVVRSHGQTVNIPREGAAGKGIHVGVIDSAYKLPSELTEGYAIRQDPENSFIDASDAMTTRHCENVFDWVSTFCPEATFTLYQAVREDKSLPMSAFSDAISQAIEDGVDILTISAGDPWPGPVGKNPNVQQIKRAIDEGITVVAAAGNFDPETQSERPPVHCPAAHEPVIAVGGLEVRCPVDPGEEPADGDAGPYYCTPDHLNDPSPPTPTDTAFCSQNGCVDDESCFGSQTETEWDYNPLPTDAKPDVLAPMHRPIGRADGPHLLKVGTSFAAPIVAGSLGCIFSESLEIRDQLPYPHRIRDAVIEGSSPIVESDRMKYDAMGTRDALGIL